MTERQFRRPPIAEAPTVPSTESVLASLKTGSSLFPSSRDGAPGKIASGRNATEVIELARQTYEERRAQIRRQ